MGLFSGLSGSGSFPKSEREAVLGLLLAVMAADGDISDDERDSFQYLANKTTSLGPMPADEFWNHVETCKAILRREGPRVLMERCTSKISEEKRHPLFVNSCDLIMRDGRVEAEEEQLIEALQQQLAIDNAFAQNVVSVILAKYSL